MSASLPGKRVISRESSATCTVSTNHACDDGCSGAADAPNSVLCLLLAQSGHGPFLRVSLSQYDVLSLSIGGGNEAARLHRPSWWRGGCLAACRAGAARRADAAHQWASARGLGRFGISGMGLGVAARGGTIRLDPREH